MGRRKKTYKGELREALTLFYHLEGRGWIIQEADAV